MRASRRFARLARLEIWLAAFSRYLAGVKDLYDYLELHPSRAGVCFAEVFRGVPEKTGAEEVGTPTLEEKEIVEAVRAPMDETLDLFSVPSETANSLEELSRLAYDPFPAPLIVQVPGPILEVEGFADQGGGVLGVPGLSLWNALRALKDRWISPDPMMIQYEHLSGNKPLDLSDLMRRPRSAAKPPTPIEIRRGLEKYLSPAQVYRVRWSTKALKELEPTEGPEDLWASPAPPEE